MATKVTIVHPTIEKALTEKGEDWVVAAMVDSSIGYHDPASARRKVKYYLEGDRQDFCERCYCLYSGDLEKMMLDDISKFEYVEASSPEWAKRVIEYCKLWEKTVGDNDIFNSVGLFYPTTMI